MFCGALLIIGFDRTIFTCPERVRSLHPPPHPHFQGESTATCASPKYHCRVPLLTGFTSALAFSTLEAQIKVKFWPYLPAGTSGSISVCSPRRGPGRHPRQDGNLQHPSYKKCWKLWRSWNKSSKKVFDHDRILSQLVSALAMSSQNVFIFFGTVESKWNNGWN